MSDISNQRLANQHLNTPTLNMPVDVVSWFGAVQAQEYHYAKWALGLRLNGLTENDVQQAFNDGKILRTHVMRPTWHFVSPKDIRWLQKLTAHRVHQVCSYINRQEGLDSASLVKSADVIVKALEGGKHLTRAELGKKLEQVGITAKGNRLSAIVMYAELEALICSGALHGKQFTYALLDERVHSVDPLTEDEALAELTKRFFTSHGPAMLDDFAWWSGLTKTTARRGLALVDAAIVSETINEKVYYYSATLASIGQVSPQAYLLPPYDEFGIAYRDHSPTLELQQQTMETKEFIFYPFAVYNGHIVGSWRRTYQKGRALIEIAPFRVFTAIEKEAFTVAAQRFGEFIGIEAEITSFEVSL